MTSIEPIADTLAELMLRAPAGFAVTVHMQHMVPNLSFRTFPDSWIEYYGAEGLALADPVIQWGAYDTGVLRWSDLVAEDGHGVLKAARQHGLTYGMAVSQGPEADRALGGFARADREFTAPEMSEVETLVGLLQDRTVGLGTLGPGATRMLANRGVTVQPPIQFG